MSCSCMACFTQTAANHSKEKRGAVKPTVSGKTPNEDQICQQKRTAEQKSHTCARINFIEPIISICYKKGVIWSHSDAKRSSTSWLIFTGSLGNNF